MPHPWDRIQQPIPLPAGIAAAELRQIEQTAFAELLRSNLLPRDQVQGHRRAWTTLWRVLAGWPDLAERTRGVLLGFMELADAHLAIDPDDRRAARFYESCAAGIDRLAPGESRTTRSPNATRADQMLAAIAQHQRVILHSGEPPREADVALWAHLRRR